MLKIKQFLALTVLVIIHAQAMAQTVKLVTFEYPPYEYTEGGLIKGIAVDVIQETFKLMKVDVTVQAYPWSRSQAMFENGEVDGIFTFFRNSEREKYTLFSKEAVVTQTISLWVSKDSRIEFNGDLTKLQTYVIGVTPRTSYGERFDSTIKHGVLRTESANTMENNIRKLIAGRIDIWVSNRDGARHELQRLGLLGSVKELKQSIQVVPAFVGFSKSRQGEALRDEFDDALGKLKRNGIYETLISRYNQSTP
jgi:polar amino acid transport system substrate-binding protein